MPSPPTPAAGDPAPAGEVAYFVVSRRHPRPGVLLVTATGEVDILTISTLTAAVADLSPVTVLDLSEVTLLSAVGLRALQKVADRAEAEGCQLRLVAANRCVLHLLRLTGLDPRVPVYQSVPTALGD